MINKSTCIIRNIRRPDADESPLLPPMTLVNVDEKWVHDDGGKETNISRIVGEQIDMHLKQLAKDPNEIRS